MESTARVVMLSRAFTGRPEFDFVFAKKVAGVAVDGTPKQTLIGPSWRGRGGCAAWRLKSLA